MTMEVLREYVIFSKHLNISAAARELNVSQPTLTKHMTDFEKEIGIQLIEHGHVMKLTPAGKIFLDDVGFILHRYDEALSKCRAVAHNITSTIRVQDPVQSAAIQKCLISAMETFPEMGVSTGIALVSTQGSSALDAIVNNLVDVSFMLSCPCMNLQKRHAHKRIVTVPLIKDKLWVRVNRNHPLAKKEVVTFSDLRNVPVPVPANKVYDDWRNVVTDIFAKNGVALSLSMRVVQTINEFTLSLQHDDVLIVWNGASSQDNSDTYVMRELRHERTRGRMQ